MCFQKRGFKFSKMKALTQSPEQALNKTSQWLPFSVQDDLDSPWKAAKWLFPVPGILQRAEKRWQSRTTLFFPFDFPAREAWCSGSTGTWLQTPPDHPLLLSAAQELQEDLHLPCLPSLSCPRASVALRHPLLPACI